MRLWDRAPADVECGSHPGPCSPATVRRSCLRSRSRAGAVSWAVEHTGQMRTSNGHSADWHRLSAPICTFVVLAPRCGAGVVHSQTGVAAEAPLVGLDRHVGLLGCARHVCVTRFDPAAVPSTYSASSSQEAHVEAPAATKRVHFAQHCTTGIVCNDMHDAYALHLCYSASHSAPLSIDKAGLRDKAWSGGGGGVVLKVRQGQTCVM